MLNQQIEEHRLLYNACLEKKQSAYENDKTNISIFDLIKSEVKVYRKIANCSSMQHTVRRLGKAFDKFFSDIKKGIKTGYPRIKKFDRFNTLEYTYTDGIKKRGEFLYIYNVGEIPCDFSRVGEIKFASITRRGDKFYANFGVENKIVKSETNYRQVGLDVGLKTFITTSDGEKFDSPKFHKKKLKEEAKIHRRIHRSPKGSKLRKKHKKSLNKLKTKISNQRKDFNHKLSRKIVDCYDFIAMEDINLNGLTTEIKNINRTYSDVAIGQFRTYVSYKAENAGKIFVKIPAYNTTKECSECGKLTDKTLKERTHKCSCGYEECRDINAAKNILRRGLASLAKA